MVTGEVNTSKHTGGMLNIPKLNMRLLAEGIWDYCRELLSEILFQFFFIETGSKKTLGLLTGGM